MDFSREERTGRASQNKSLTVGSEHVSPPKQKRKAEEAVGYPSDRLNVFNDSLLGLFSNVPGIIEFEELICQNEKDYFEKMNPVFEKLSRKLKKDGVLADESIREVLANTPMWINPEWFLFENKPGSSIREEILSSSIMEQLPFCDWRTLELLKDLIIKSKKPGALREALAKSETEMRIARKFKNELVKAAKKHRKAKRKCEETHLNSEMRFLLKKIVEMDSNPEKKISIDQLSMQSSNFLTSFCGFNGKQKYLC